MKRIICILSLLCAFVNLNAQKIGKHAEKAFKYYETENYSKASHEFELDYKATGELTSLYNAGFTAWQCKEYQRASQLFTKCIDEYYYYDGEVYSKLADCYMNLGNKDLACAFLEKGFLKYPNNQAILIGLINYYMENKHDVSRLKSLMNTAKANEPNNASLYYVEGNIYNEMGMVEEARHAYEYCEKVDPTYIYGHIGIGVMYYNLAVEIQEKANNELNDAKYNVYLDEFERVLKECINPFEKAYRLCTDNEIRVSIAEYLANIYFRFSDDNTEYKNKYNKYKNIVETKRAY